MSTTINKNIIIVRGAGDIASGVIARLHRSGYKVIALEIERPSSIRRMVSFSEAVYEGSFSVEGIGAELCKDFKSAKNSLDKNTIPILIDPECKILNELRPLALIDAILAKKNLGTSMTMSNLVIGLGPGFNAGQDSHFVIETNRGHELGKIISHGSSQDDTGIPGLIANESYRRVLRSSAEGRIKISKDIASLVKAGDKVFSVITMEGLEIEVKTEISGIVRGIIRNGIHVPKNLKIADIDPRASEKSCYTISDKSLSIAGSVLEVLLRNKILPYTYSSYE